MNISYKMNFVRFLDPDIIRLQVPEHKRKKNSKKFKIPKELKSTNYKTRS